MISQGPGWRLNGHDASARLLDRQVRSGLEVVPTDTMVDVIRHAAPGIGGWLTASQRAGSPTPVPPALPSFLPARCTGADGPWCMVCAAALPEGFKLRPRRLVQANVLLCNDEEGGVVWAELMTVQGQPPVGNVRAAPASPPPAVRCPAPRCLAELCWWWWW